MKTLQAAVLLLCATVVLCADKPKGSSKKVVCYFTNWSYKREAPFDFTPDKIDPFVCTHIIYAFVDIGAKFNLVPSDSKYDFDERAFINITSLKRQNKDLKVMVGIGGWIKGTEGFARITSNDTTRKEFAKNAVRFIRGYQFDGLDLNWQHPTFRQGGTPADKENYVLLAQTLREEFEKEAKSKNKPRLLLSIAISHNEKFLPAYDISSFNIYMDFISVICYDYHFSYEEAVNHHSPLYSLEEDNDYNYDAKVNINYTIHYFSQLADPDKLVMGIPAYGRSYKLVNPEDHALGANADGPGDGGPVTKEKGWFAHFEICNFVKNEDWTVVQTKPGSAGPYAYKGDQWVGYDDLDMTRTKAAYAKEKGLGGVMFWTMDYDDFLGRCDSVKFPLIRAARNELLGTEAIDTSAPVSNDDAMVFPDYSIEEGRDMEVPIEGTGRVVQNPTPVQPSRPPPKPVTKCSSGRHIPNTPIQQTVPQAPPLPVLPRQYPREGPSSNLVGELLQLIEKAGGMKNFCKIISQDQNLIKSTLLHKRGFNERGDSENSIVFEAPNLPPILVVLSNSSVYIKEINVHNHSG